MKSQCLAVLSVLLLAGQAPGKIIPNHAIADLVLPVLQPRAYLPVHWDGLYGAFNAGVPSAYADTALAARLKAGGVELIRPTQYMDKWRLDRHGVRAIPNDAVKAALGFAR